LLEGVKRMRESKTYQAILRKGRNEGLIETRNAALFEGRVIQAQRLVLLQGEIRFGPPVDATRNDINAIRDLERLERIVLRLLDASIPDWKSLLTTL
jgi:predicted transposase YdaD